MRLAMLGPRNGTLIAGALLAVLCQCTPALAHGSSGPQEDTDGDLRMRVYSQIFSPANETNYAVPLSLSFVTDEDHKIVLNNLDNVGHDFDYKWSSKIEFWGGSWGVTPTLVDEVKSPGYDTGGWVTWFAAALGELVVVEDPELSAGQQFNNAEEGVHPMTAQSTLTVTSRAGNVNVGVGHSHVFGLI